MSKEKNVTKEGKAVNADPAQRSRPRTAGDPVKFEVYGEEMLEKLVKPSGNSGRVYLPPDWVGYRVKVIRIG